MYVIICIRDMLILLVFRDVYIWKGLLFVACVLCHCVLHLLHQCITMFFELMRGEMLKYVKICVWVLTIG